MVAAVLHLQERAGVAFQMIDRMRLLARRRHDVGDRDARAAVPGAGVELLLVADDAVDFRHRGELLRIDLRGAAGDDDARLRPLALDAADRLARLPHRFRGHRAGVHHHGVADTGRLRLVADHLGFGDVEPAAEGDEVDAHTNAAPALLIPPLKGEVKKTHGARPGANRL